MNNLTIGHSPPPPEGQLESSGNIWGSNCGRVGSRCRACEELDEIPYVLCMYIYLVFV